MSEQRLDATAVPREVTLDGIDPKPGDGSDPDVDEVARKPKRKPRKPKKSE